MRFHTQTAGSTLTAQQPHNNVVRTTVQALAATLGGTQSLHTNSFDEALGLPTEDSARLALRTQQILAHESGVTDTVDPLAGSYYVESLTNEIESRAHALITEIQSLGGAVAAIEEGFQQLQIEDAAYEAAQGLESDDVVVVGVNRYQEEAEMRVPISEIDPALERHQSAAVADRRSRRDRTAVDAGLRAIRSAAEGDSNVMPPMKAALYDGASLGEVSDVLREVFGVYRPGR